MSGEKELLLLANVSGTEQLAIIYKGSKTKKLTKAMSIDPGKISADIDLLSVDRQGIEIEVEQKDGIPIKVWKKGGQFFSRGVSPGEQSGRPRTNQDKGNQTQSPGPMHSLASANGGFHNPYNFIPTPPRDTNDPVLGDMGIVPERERPDHGLFQEARLSGTIRLLIRTETPMVLLDPGNAKPLANRHRVFPVREDGSGNPSLHPASVKGMIRSAFEAITNSRYSVLNAWDKPLVHRIAGKKRDFNNAPRDLLPRSLQEALSWGELSPADRVFGWVKSDKGNNRPHKLPFSDSKDADSSEPAAWKGCFRVKNIFCLTTNAIEKFPPNKDLPLNILAQPKPQQARFYCAKSKNGEPLSNGANLEREGYSANSGLRGRKVYPHHNGLPENHWSDPWADRTNLDNHGRYQEYRRPGKDKDRERDDQNRTIRGWVKPGTVFQAEIHVQNISAAELGGLLWLFSLPDGHFLRLGGAKPFGLGSVKLDWVPEHSNIGDGRDWARYYSLESALPSLDPAFCIKEFKKAVANAYGKSFYETSSDKSFMEVSFIKAFLTACSGHKDKLPVHYPRVRPAHVSNGPVPPHPEGKSYEWFVANNRSNCLALPSLAEGQGLPYLQKQPSKERGHYRSR